MEWWQGCIREFPFRSKPNTRFFPIARFRRARPMVTTTQMASLLSFCSGSEWFDEPPAGRSQIGKHDGAFLSSPNRICAQPEI